MSAEPERKSRNRLLYLGALLLLVGMVIGAAGGVLATRHVVHRAMKNPDNARDRFVARVKTQLKLRDDQAPKFDSIVATRVEGLREIRVSSVPAVRAEFAALDADMRKLLDADQAAIWERHYARIQNLVPR